MTETTTSDHPARERAPRTTGRHPVDIGHLVMGIAFAGMVAVWALFEGGVVDGDDLSWFLPLPWLAAGAAGLAALAVAGRRRRRRDAGALAPAYSADPPSETPTDPQPDPNPYTPEENR